MKVNKNNSIDQTGQRARLIQNSGLHCHPQCNLFTFFGSSNLNKEV